MESLVVHPENEEQLEAVKAALRALNVEFEPNQETLPPHILKGITAGIEQYERDGKSISFEEFKEKHFSKR